MQKRLPLLGQPRPPAIEAGVTVPVGQFEPTAPGDKPGDGVGPMPEVTGWKTELDRELLEQLVIAAKIGGFRKQCALACGVRPELLKFWLEEGMREDAEPLWQELSARFQGATNNTTLNLVAVIERAGRTGDWAASAFLLKGREPLWRGSERWEEAETAPPATSLKDRQRQLIDELREARLNPFGPLADALREAGFPLDAPERPESGELHALLSRGKGENPEP